jgi:hypothetical protein
MEKWQSRKALILGTTYPNHSEKYTETVCTGALFEDTLRMCRLYPVPRRYLEHENRFRSFQWITAEVHKDPSDPRPESYKINAKSIAPLDVIPSRKYELRRSLLEGSPNFCKSVEGLLDRQRAEGMSLGILVPESITDCSIEMRPERERAEWMRLEEARARQEVLFGERPKPLAFPEALFFVHWRCNDDRCKGHRMSLHQWGIHELYRKYEDREEAKEKVLQAMHRRLNEGARDIYLLLGSFRSVMYNFGLMDTYECPARDADREGFSLFDDQPSLFN